MTELEMDFKLRFKRKLIQIYSSSLNRCREYAKARDCLENVFEIHLELRDRMELRKEVESSINESIVNSDIATYTNPYQLACEKFLIFNYPSLDRALVATSIFEGKDNSGLNSEIRRLRET